MTPAERIQWIIDQSLTTPNAFARSIGVSADTIYKILNGDTTSLTKNLVKRITDTDKNLRSEWLLTGEGLRFTWQKDESDISSLKESLTTYPSHHCPECSNKDRIISTLWKKLEEKDKEIEKIRLSKEIIPCQACIEKDKEIGDLKELLMHQVREWGISNRGNWVQEENKETG